ncbi:peptidase M20/M25/M40-like protein [Tamaricihabitans halophyticus]|uniref:Peptidase M20/M25/M40-like protein n=1 Tax=Tamaricihabitans halophyticus TaxID=1262583 RepID=A0A4R2QVH5_9PSEU|nr:peptidase M20/M25/M40-like protein [Tamaricihabitans halophyticus]
MAAQCRPRTQLSWATAEKGTSWLRISVHGTAGHAANPSNMDNALVTAAEVITRLATQQGEPVPAEQLTVTPTGVRGGIAINSIPELVEIDVDARTLPGQGRAEVVDELRTALGDLLDVVELDWLHELYTASAPSSTRLLDSVRRIADDLVPGTELVPSLVVGSTDAEYFRQAGARAYGFAMTSDYASPGEFAGMFHGANERIDVRSLELSTRLWEQLARTF